ASGAAADTTCLRRYPTRVLLGRKRRADPESFHGCGDGSRNAYFESHEPRRDSCGRCGNVRSSWPAPGAGGSKGGSESRAEAARAEGVGDEGEGEEKDAGQEKESEQVSGPENTSLRVPAGNRQTVALPLFR